MQHLAVIMDGNGRWAQKRHLPRLMGHRAGADALDRTMHWCKEAGIKYLTVYAFSTENWKRPEDEVAGLMDLFAKTMLAEVDGLHAEKPENRLEGGTHTRDGMFGAINKPITTAAEMGPKVSEAGRIDKPIKKDETRI